MNAQWFVDNGCELTKPDIKLFYSLYSLLNGNPCNGCNCKDTCPAWPKLAPVVHRAAKIVSNLPTCPQCESLLNPVKVARRGGKCACGATV